MFLLSTMAQTCRPRTTRMPICGLVLRWMILTTSPSRLRPLAPAWSFRFDTAIFTKSPFRAKCSFRIGTKMSSCCPSTLTKPNPSRESDTMPSNSSRLLERRSVVRTGASSPRASLFARLSAPSRTGAPLLLVFLPFLLPLRFDIAIYSLFLRDSKLTNIRKI